MCDLLLRLLFCKSKEYFHLLPCSKNNHSQIKCLLCISDCSSVKRRTLEPHAIFVIFVLFTNMQVEYLSVVSTHASTYVS